MVAGVFLAATGAGCGRSIHVAAGERTDVQEIAVLVHAGGSVGQSEERVVDRRQHLVDLDLLQPLDPAAARGDELEELGIGVEMLYGYRE